MTRPTREVAVYSVAGAKAAAGSVTRSADASSPTGPPLAPSSWPTFAREATPSGHGGDAPPRSLARLVERFGPLSRFAPACAGRSSEASGNASSEATDGVLSRVDEGAARDELCHGRDVAVEGAVLYEWLDACANAGARRGDSAARGERGALIEAGGSGEDLDRQGISDVGD